MLIRSDRGRILRAGSWIGRLSVDVWSSTGAGASACHRPVDVATAESAATDAQEPAVPGYFAFHAELGGTLF